MNNSIFLCIAIALAFLIQWAWITYKTNAGLVSLFSQMRQKISFDAFYINYKWPYFSMLLFVILQILLFAFCLFSLIATFSSNFIGYICWACIVMFFAKARIFYSTALFVILRGPQ